MLAVFLVVAPDADWAHAVALALQSAALLVVVATSRASAAVRRARAHHRRLRGDRRAVRRRRRGGCPTGSCYLIAMAMSLAIPIALVGGLVRLIRRHGVTLQAVAGALTIYVLLGARVRLDLRDRRPAHSRPVLRRRIRTVTQGERVYFSFTALTTTGFGDLTVATSAGRALVLVEMLVGQLYLVTVIGMLIGSFGRPRA